MAENYEHEQSSNHRYWPCLVVKALRNEGAITPDDIQSNIEEELIPGDHPDRESLILSLNEVRETLGFLIHYDSIDTFRSGDGPRVWELVGLPKQVVLLFSRNPQISVWYLCADCVWSPDNCIEENKLPKLQI